MKLIIDIDDKDMDKIRQSDKAIFCDIYRMMANIIQHGIPLDDLRAELHATAEMHDDGDYYLRDEWIDEYFDEYKAERSE